MTVGKYCLSRLRYSGPISAVLCIALTPSNHSPYLLTLFNEISVSHSVSLVD